MFYGVSEPMSHFSSSLGGVTLEDGVRTDWAPLGAASNEAEAIRLGMAATIFHWGLHPWAIYAIVGLALALFSYNKGLPLTIRSAFHPIFGDRVWGWPGHIIDTLAVFATLFGLATSLGFGATQAASGLAFLFGSGVAEEGTRNFLGMPFGNTEASGVANSSTLLVLLITGITGIALYSVMRGLDGGVKVLSEINMGLAFLLLVFVLLAGPTLALISGFGRNLWAYLGYLPALSNPFGRGDVNFMQGWTSFYWAWWISWSPFVGMFIARVSRGRTVREFVICVLLIPSTVCVLWMSVFGGTALIQVVRDGFTAAQDAPLELQLFQMLGALPLAQITSFVGIVLVIVFFVTSSDSGSLVIDTITAGGKVDAPVPQRVFWCVFEGAVAMVLLLSVGGLGALQSMVISTGLPFTVVLLLMCWAILKGLRAEPI
jgi:BCCT family betaine/carnitine transporter